MKSYEELSGYEKFQIYKMFLSRFSREYIADVMGTSVEVVARVVKEGEEGRVPLLVPPKAERPKPRFVRPVKAWEARERLVEATGLDLEGLTVEELESLLSMIEEELRKRGKKRGA